MHKGKQLTTLAWLPRWRRPGIFEVKRYTYIILNGFLAISPSRWSDGISLIASEIVCIGGLHFRVGMWHHKTFFMENGELSAWGRELLLCRKKPWVTSSGRWRRGHWGSASGGRPMHTAPSKDTSVRVQAGQAHFPCFQRHKACQGPLASTQASTPSVTSVGPYRRRVPYPPSAGPEEIP